MPTVPRPERPRGFTALPCRCPGCQRRVPVVAPMVFGTFTRCDGCREPLFVLVLPDIRAGFIAQLRAAQVIDMQQRRLTPLQVLRELGFGIEGAAA